MIKYYNDHHTWTCTKDDCSKCVGKWCKYYTLTVSTEGAVSDLSPVSDCKYGNTVKVERIVVSWLCVWEMKVIGKGKPNICFLVLVPKQLDEKVATTI